MSEQGRMKSDAADRLTIRRTSRGIASFVTALVCAVTLGGGEGRADTGDVSLSAHPVSNSQKVFDGQAAVLLPDGRWLLVGGEQSGVVSGAVSFSDPRSSALQKQAIRRAFRLCDKIISSSNRRKQNGLKQNGLAHNVRGHRSWAGRTSRNRALVVLVSVCLLGLGPRKAFLESREERFTFLGREFLAAGSGRVGLHELVEGQPKF